MGGLKHQLLALTLAVASFSNHLLLTTQSGTREVTADELLAYGIVPPQPTSAPPGPSRTDPTATQTTTTTAPPPAIDPDAAAFDDDFDIEGGGGARLSDSDFVFAGGTCMKRIRLAAASRAWRGPDVRAFFLVDSQAALPELNARGGAAGEAYAFFPSEGAPELGGVVRSLRAGDTRAAAAPFAAHRHFGDTYKWMLYGDDDTVFFLEPVRRLLSRLDPDLPIALSDNLWHSGRHPNPQAPRCLPCHAANDTSLPTLEQIMTSSTGRVEIRASYQQRGREGLISKEEYLAFARNTTVVPGERYRPQPACPYCTTEAACAPVTQSGSTAPCQASIAHGGAGVIFSVGLLRSLPYRDALSCFLSFTNASGGDHMVSECLWRHGIAFTDPGGLVRHLYNYQYVVFGGAPRLPALLGLSTTSGGGVPAGGKCDELCRWMLRNAVSMHLHARLHKSVKALAAHQAEVPRARAAALNRLALRRQGGKGGKDGSGR